MPKLFEYLGIMIMFYSNEHEPIHVHGKHGGLESKAELLIEEGRVVSVRVKDVKGKRPLGKKELREFEVFVTAFKDDIVKKWVDYFVYHRSIQCIRIEGRVKA